jgi:hypothetical protein
LYEHRVQNYGPLLLVDPKAGMTARELAYFGEQRGEIHSGYVFAARWRCPRRSIRDSRR